MPIQRRLARLARSLYLATCSYVLLNLDTPKRFVIRDLPAQSIGIVMHCQETRRTTVGDMRSAGMDWSPFEEQLCFVSDGKEVKVDVIVIYDPEDPPSPALKPFLLALASSTSLSLKLSFSTAVSSRAPSALQVEREGARTTIMYLSDLFQINCDVTVNSEEQRRFEMRWAALAALESAVEDPERTNPISIRWQYGPHESAQRLPVLSYGIRTLLKGAWEARLQADGSLLGFSPSAQVNGKRLISNIEEGRLNTLPFVDRSGNLLSAAVERGPWCSICAKSEGLKQCGGCGWEYYCSAEHQQQEWPHHKRWCKSNPKSEK
ncbi:hypothetical protein BCR35DRAFT_332476 [Leucosporidium creatinivorum]|uniref:MYND-type domain-containing protein n=1 Tax=Leucosporidium creatinivorum TaxID=106004 RepID=A0A1Y2F338_9BASI|nr:hypothetical protein BCR35DRAFT_332476 [Leucosporidium creatinivorum]